jgi:peptidyl-prolyl cis-trans isomerase B (cyclophilin B)
MHQRLLPLALILVGCSGTPSQGGAIEIKPVPPRPVAASTAAPTPKPTATTDTPATAPSLPPAQQSALDEVARASGQQIRAIHRLSFQTTKGEIVITTFPDQAPKAAAKFTSLVTAGTYDGTTFHRVIPNFVAQGGDPQSKTLPVGDPRIGYGTSGEDVPDDFANHLKHLQGSVALAHDGRANSSNCQFYICLAAQPSLDDRYIVFGHVLSGLDVALALAPTDAGGTPDKITKATLLE